MKHSSQYENPGLLRMTWRFRKSATIIFTPLLLLPLPLLGKAQSANCIFMICVMAIYWATEACPLAVTSLLPTVLCPLLGIQDANTTAMTYINHAIFLVIGTLVMCISIEECGLHRRVALRVLLWFGSEPRWVLLGLMSITAFLSMWMMNMSTLSLMLPITLAVCNEMDGIVNEKHARLGVEILMDDQPVVKEESEQRSRHDDDICNETFDKDSDRKIEAKSVENGRPTLRSFQKPMLIGISYASSIGGISTAVGTPANMIGLGIFYDRFNDTTVNFVTWLSFCLPISIVGLLMTWLWILIRFLSIRDLFWCRKNDPSNKVGNMLKTHYNNLPQMSFAEKVVAFHFIILIILWIFRDPKLFTGWSSMFIKGYVKDSTAAVLIGISIFLFPAKSSSFTWMWRKRTRTEPPPIPGESLLSWKTFQTKFPWDVMLLIGSGFAIAGACNDSGLSASIGYVLKDLRGTSPWLIILAISTLTSITTEFAGNTAVVGLLLPILLSMSDGAGMHPIMILLAVTLPASFAFTLPVASPCNALVFSTGTITIPDMLWTGIPLNFFFVGLLNFLLFISGPRIFDFGGSLNGTTAGNWTFDNATAIA